MAQAASHTAQAIVMENSAISPDLQELAGKWLKPDVTVLSNTLPDHQEAWGPSSTSAAEVLTRGIPKGGKVILPDLLEGDSTCRPCYGNACETLFAAPANRYERIYRAATWAWRWPRPSTWAWRSSPPCRPCSPCRDSYDFSIFEHRRRAGDGLFRQ